MQGAVEAQEAGVGGAGVREGRQFAGHEVVQRAAVQLVGVVAVVVVLEHHLPVPGEGTGHDRRPVAGAEVVGCDGLGDLGQPRGQRRGVRIEIDEDEAEPGLQLEGRQGDGGLVEVAGPLHRRRVHQVAVEAVDPVVIGADEAAGIAPPLGHQHRPVLADRRHRLQLVRPGAGDNDRLADDPGGEIVARRRDPGLPTDAEPFVIEQRLLLELVEGRVGVAGRRQGLGPVEVEDRAGHALEEGVGEERHRGHPWLTGGTISPALNGVLHQRAPAVVGGRVWANRGQPTLHSFTNAAHAGNLAGATSKSRRRRCAARPTRRFRA